MVECAVKICGNSLCKGPQGITYHRFPTVRKIALEWAKILGFSNSYKIRETDRICSKHFLKDDFVVKLYTDNRIRTFLKPGSLPLPPIEDPQQVYVPRTKFRKLKDWGCTVKNCKSTKKKRIPGVTFHRLPSASQQAHQWLEILGFRSKYIRKNERICSKHFLKGDFEEKLTANNRTRKCLKPWALPLPPFEDPQQAQESSSNSKPKPLLADKERVTTTVEKVENVEVKEEPAEDDYGVTTNLTTKMKNYKRKTARDNINEENMMAAIRDILNRTMTTKQASQHYGILKPTLYTRLKRLKAETASLDPQEITLKMGLKIQDKCSKHASNQVFTIEDENFIVNYLLTCSEIDFGLTIEEIRELAYRYAVLLDRKFPESWSRNQKTGKDWAMGFLKRHREVSYRKSENVPINILNSALPSSLRHSDDAGTPPEASGDQALDLSMRSRDFHDDNEMRLVHPKRAYPYLRREPLDLSMTSLALVASPAVPLILRQFGGLETLRPIPNLHTNSGVNRGMSSTTVTKSPELRKENLKEENLPLSSLEDPLQIHGSSSKSKRLVADGGRVSGLESTIQVKEEPIEDECEVTTDLESLIEVLKEEITEEPTEYYYKIIEM